MNKIKVPWHFLILLILAGELVFVLPFVIPRIFRPTVLETFGLDNLQLGLCYSAYGFVALLAYLIGGPIADRYPPGKLISISLWMTGIGGFLFATYPSFLVLKFLYAYWGFTTIFLFWAPMIKAARVWGGPYSQAKAFGFLDGGRGLVGALFGFFGVMIFSSFISSDVDALTLNESQQAFAPVIYSASVLVILSGILTWFFLKLDNRLEKEISIERISTDKIKTVLRLPAVWLLMIIILSAYVGYKVTDVISLYAKEVMEYDQVQSAQVGTLLLFVRPIIGFLVGIYADRFLPVSWLLYSFIISLIGAILFASGYLLPSVPVLFFISTIVIAVGIYAARALYFAVMQKGQIPIVLTGTAVGLVSIIGYTPDIFAGPAMGYLLDMSPGIKGHQHVFLMLAIFSLIGTLATFKYLRLFSKKEEV